MHRWFLLIGAGSLLGLFLIGALWIWMSVKHEHTTPPPLVQNLPGSDIATQSKNFEARLLKRYPIGSDAQLLLSELGDEGFDVHERTEPLGYQGGAGWRCAPCAHDVQIWWIRDYETGRLTSLGGSYGYAK